MNRRDNSEDRSSPSLSKTFDNASANDPTEASVPSSAPGAGATTATSGVLAEDPIVAGTQIGEYVVEAQLGRGAFGDVFRAVHPVIGKTVAIKVLNARYSIDPAVVSRFVSEARAVNKIGHEHIIDIFSFGQFSDGRHYFVMAYLDGTPLDDYLATHGKLDPAEVLEILGPLGEALDAAHAAGIAHRDLKPANVFLVRKGSNRWSPKLLDFGIAKLMHDDIPKAHETGAGMAVGTPHYMSPEQCRGDVDVDHRTDIYAFGILAFQLLTGRLPFEGTRTMDVLVQHIVSPPPSPLEFCPDLPPRVAEMILWMLKKERSERPSSLGAAMEALRSASRDRIPVPEPNPNLPGDGDGAPDATRRVRPPEESSSQTMREPGAGTATLQPDTMSVTPPKNSTRRAVALGALLLVTSVAGATLFGLTRQHEAAGVSAEASADSAAGEDSPTIVEITIEGAPEGAVVTRASDDHPLGIVPGPIRLARSDEVVPIVITADQYIPLPLELVADETKTLVLSMRPAPVEPPTQTGATIDGDARPDTAGAAAEAEAKAEAEAEAKTEIGKANDTAPKTKAHRGAQPPRTRSSAKRANQRHSGPATKRSKPRNADDLETWE
ncbi:MAG: serine/threonine protein kinase [Deltaproteobacteria bacterium]|nr:serine/threonine protein kinase [Deltaproteobacteria bacterium]